MADTDTSWPNGARLAVSFPLIFEAAGQPISGAGGVIPDPIEHGPPELPGAHRRRMMVVSLHDRISGHANRARVLDRFPSYARSKPDVWFARKDEIADVALKARAGTQVYDRGAPTVSGLPGPGA